MKNALGSINSVLILGGGSDIALSTARALVRDQTTTVVLAARRPEALADAVTELTGLGAKTVEAIEFDGDNLAGHNAFIHDTFTRYGDFDAVIIAFGVLGDQEEAERSGEAAVDIVRTNYLDTVSVTVPLVNQLKAQGHGVIVALSSVAGERARKANFVYGSSKAGMDAYFQGLADSLVGSGVRVMIVRPGFVHTKMTTGMDPAPLSTTPEAVADAIVKGLRRGSTVIWVPGPLRFVMSALRHVPRPIFRKLPI
jgi:decaprenylphospho-beta-D-erythro-pentofuranosid-2-ulose 2-reductase